MTLNISDQIMTTYIHVTSCNNPEIACWTRKQLHMEFEVVMRQMWWASQVISRSSPTQLTLILMNTERNHTSCLAFSSDKFCCIQERCNTSSQDTCLKPVQHGWCTLWQIGIKYTFGLVSRTQQLEPQWHTADLLKVDGLVLKTINNWLICAVNDEHFCLNCFDYF